MRLLVLGAGLQGCACAYDLLENTEHDVVLADLHVDDLPAFLQPHLEGRLTTLALDARDEAAVAKAMEGATATMSALPYYFNDRMARIAVQAGSHFCDLGGNTEIVIRQKAMHSSAVEAGVSIVADCGLAPGMVNILAAEGIRRLDQTSEVYLKVGGLPQFPEPPLNYQVVYSLEGVLDYYTTLSWILRDGDLEQVAALSEIEDVEFAEVGKLEAFHTAGGLSLMAQKYKGEIDRMEYKTLRYPGHAEAMKAMRDIGLFSTEPQKVGDREIVPRDFFIETVGPKLRLDPAESPDLVALRVEVHGTLDGRKKGYRWDLIDRYDADKGITAMMRTTGFSLAITALLQADGTVPPGTWTPDEAIPAEQYISALAARGVKIQESEIES